MWAKEAKDDMEDTCREKDRRELKLNEVDPCNRDV